MAKVLAKNAPPTGKEAYAFPSRFGSHASMVVSENDDGTVICKDEFGEYHTLKNRIDNRSADPNRYSAHSRIPKTKAEFNIITHQFGPGAVWVDPEKEKASA